MHVTKNDLPEEVRNRAVELLNARLADCVDLQSQAKHAHWNVKGPNAAALHELFDKVGAAVEGDMDVIAERAVQLGGVACGTIGVVSKRTLLPEYPEEAMDGRSHVDALSTTLAAFGKSVRAAIDQADKLRDLGAADVFTQVSRDIDKWTWLVEAHSYSDGDSMD